jgi:thiol-disulfide isomerase/thioredoxin
MGLSRGILVLGSISGHITPLFARKPLLRELYGVKTRINPVGFGCYCWQGFGTMPQCSFAERNDGMDENDKNNLIKAWPVYLVCVILIGLVVWVVRKNPPRHSGKPMDEVISGALDSIRETGDNAPQSGHSHEETADLAGSGEGETAGGSLSSNLTLIDIVKNARTWGQILPDWQGKPPQDFSFTDIAGAEHKLSDYKGKDVMVIFWATWCPPCNMEIPHLIELRNSVGKDELAMIAISDENPQLVKDFASRKSLNYTVVGGRIPLPPPFAYARALPTSFFIDKTGNVKLVAEGMMTESEAKAILLAEE